MTFPAPPTPLPDPLPRRLNLGCGRRGRDDCLNVDVIPAVEPDLVWDLDRVPLPLPASWFERIWVNDVVEHLEDVVSFMTEVHRLLVPGGTIEITTPHFSSSNAFTDPTHRRQLGYFSFDYFTDASQLSFYSATRFEITRRTLVFRPSRLGSLVSHMANRYPEAYERRWTWLAPAWFLIFELTAVKPGHMPP